MQIEPLEPRLLFSSASLINGLLSVEGSAGRDRIRVDFWHLGSGPTVSVLINGHRQPLRGVAPGEFINPQSVLLRAGGGADNITLSTPFGEFPTTVHGGSGSDKIIVNARGAKVFGDRGDDTITLNPNDEDPNGAAFGGDGDDLITGSNWNSNLHGGNGNDMLIGGSGADQLFGDAGNDILKGGDGIDTYFGGDGNDRMYAADANADEPVDGGDGIDRVYYDKDCVAPIDDLEATEKFVSLASPRNYICWI